MTTDYLIWENEEDVPTGGANTAEPMKRENVRETLRKNADWAGYALAIIGAALLLRAAEGSRILPEKLKNSGIRVTDVPLYDTVRCCAKADELRERIRNRALDGVTFTSASTVHSFAEAVGREKLRGLAALCIGPVTAEAAKSYEMKPFTAQEATETALLALCKTVLEG